MQLKKKVLILFAHPATHKSRINNRLKESVMDLEGVTFHDLYEAYPDFHIDVKKEQELLLEHDLIIWQHPFYWYSAPAILKEWIDLVLEHNFAYGRKGKTLEGKQALTVITTGGRREAYQEGGFNSYTIPQFLAPFKQTARLCNMEYLPPFVVHGTHLLADEELDRYARDYKNLLISLRDDIITMDDIFQFEYLNDMMSEMK